MNMSISICYFLLISLISVIVTIFDKIRAIHNKYRIRESTLLILSVMGGSVATYVTMLIINHKTRKPKFMIGIPAIIFLQLSALIVFGMVTGYAWN